MGQVRTGTDSQKYRCVVVVQKQIHTYFLCVGRVEIVIQIEMSKGDAHQSRRGYLLMVIGKQKEGNTIKDEPKGKE